MNRLFGEKSVPMRSTTITQEAGYLGSFPRILKPGDIQSLVFTPSDVGPFWMSSCAEREASRHDVNLRSVTVINLKPRS
jgi:hypothetical protein